MRYRLYFAALIPHPPSPSLKSHTQSHHELITPTPPKICNDTAKKNALVSYYSDIGYMRNIMLHLPRILQVMIYT